MALDQAIAWRASQAPLSKVRSATVLPSNSSALWHLLIGIYWDQAEAADEVGFSQSLGWIRYASSKMQTRANRCVKQQHLSCLLTDPILMLCPFVPRTTRM